MENKCNHAILGKKFNGKIQSRNLKATIVYLFYRNSENYQNILEKYHIYVSLKNLKNEALFRLKIKQIDSPEIVKVVLRDRIRNVG